MKSKAGDRVEKYGRKDREMGQAMVEWALIFPVFLVLFCGIIDFCWIGYQQLMFESSFQMTAWDFTLNLHHPWGGPLKDIDILEETRPSSYGTTSPGDAVTVVLRSGDVEVYGLGEGIKKHMLQSTSGFLLKEDELTVPNASATFDIRSIQDTYRAGETDIKLESYQLQVVLEGDLEYRVKLLTPISRAFIPSGEVILRKKLVRERIERVAIKRRVAIPAGS